MFYSGILRVLLEALQQLDTTIDFICWLHFNHHRIAIDLDSRFFRRRRLDSEVLFDSNDMDHSVMRFLVVTFEPLLWMKVWLVSASIVTRRLRMLDATLITLMHVPMFTIYSLYELDFISSNREQTEVFGKCHFFAHHTNHRFSSNLCGYTLNHRTLSHDPTTTVDRGA